MSIRGRLQRRALSPKYNIVTDDEVQRQLRLHNKKELLDYKKYNRVLRNGGLRGIQGGYAYQLAGVGIEHPMIYFAEVHVFQEISTGKMISILVSFQVDEETKGIIKNTGDVCVIDDGNPFVSAQYIANGQIVERKDGHKMVFLFDTFEEAKTRADEEFEKYQQTIQFDDEQT